MGIISIMLNIYSQFNDTEHIAIIPPYIANYACNLREAERKVKLLNKEGIIHQRSPPEISYLASEKTFQSEQLKIYYARLHL